MEERHKRHIHHSKKDKKKKKAFLSKRAYAFSIDFFLIALINKAILFTYLSFMKSNFFYLPADKKISLLGNIDQLHFPILFFVFWGYYLTSLYLGNGQTPGKIALHLRVVDEAGGPHLSIKECFMRTLGYFICTMSGFILLGIPYLTKDARGIPDWLSNTRAQTKEELQSLDIEADHTLQLDLFKHVIPMKNRSFHFAEADSIVDTEGDKFKDFPRSA